MSKHKYDAVIYRRFAIRWVGSHVVCTLLFFVFHSLCFIGGIISMPDGQPEWATHLRWDMYATLAPTFALLPTLVILSLLQSIVSRRTIDILPRDWFKATSAVYTAAYLALFIRLFQSVTHNTLNGSQSSLDTLFMPLYLMFVVMALVQGLCLLRYGVVNAFCWSLGSLLTLLVLIPFNNDVFIHTGTLIFNFYPLLTVYPILLSFVTGLLSYRLWKQGDMRKRHMD